MTAIRFVEPPPPAAGQQWCVMCLMLAKQLQCDLSEDAISKYRLDGHDREKWIEWPAAARLRPGSYRAVSDMPALGLVDLCWDHVAGLKLTAMPAPGLMRGRG